MGYNVMMVENLDSALAHDPETPPMTWRPDPATARDSELAKFAAWLNDTRGHAFDAVADYGGLQRWSVDHPEAFWAAVAEYFDVVFGAQPVGVLTTRRLPDAKWFPGATVNYAAHALREGPGKSTDDLAVVFRREDGLRTELTYGELRSQVATARQALIGLGVRRGDRVVALVPNCPQALVAFLATASLGAVWSSCSPEFGARAVQDRFAQLEPSVLITVDGYVYQGREVDLTETVAELRTGLPSLSGTVGIGYLNPGAFGTGIVSWEEFLSGAEPAGLEFDPVPFDHPLWVLYSSGTTGLPKGIVHGHGGMLLEHLKALGLHCDLGPGSRFFWYTTTGWMMWNFLIAGLLVGSAVVLYDGSPMYPDVDGLWQLAEAEQVTYLGVSAAYLSACQKRGAEPGRHHDLTRLRAVGSTGSPLPPAMFDWIAEHVGSHVQTCSVSGGTDMCTAFIGSAPTVPVWRGEISAIALGAAVEAFDPAGRAVIGEVGELVITRPMPAMPVALWNDPDGSRLREAYFSDFPGVWRHGDWIRITPRGSCVLYGRSDATLNRGGVRMGTAEFYRVIEAFPEVIDSLVVDTSGAGEGSSAGELLCGVVLSPGAALGDIESRLARALRSQLSPRHVPDRFVAIQEVPVTLNGKKCEVPVKRILAGVPPERAVSLAALRNPAALGAVCDKLRG